MRLRWYQSLPINGAPGTEFYNEFFKDDVSIGTRVTEVPDDPIGFRWNDQFRAFDGPTPNRFPQFLDPISDGQWAAIELIPISECWRWFDSHRTTPCPFESDPSGMASIKVKIHTFGWGDNEFKPGGGFTKVQQEFADMIKSEWIVSPVFHSVFGWVPCHLEYKSPFFWDPVATDFPGKFGLYYGFAIRVIFNSDLFLWTLHLRTWRADDTDPTWEIPVTQSLDAGVNFLLGVNGALYADNFHAASPFQSRDIEQYGIADQIWPRFGPMGPFGLLGFDPIRVSLCNVTPYERGTENPAQGPLDMPRRKIEALALHDGSTGSVAGGVKMPIGQLLIDSGDWHPTGSPADALVVPSGVSLVRGIAQVDCSAAGTSWTHLFRLNDDHPPASPAQTNLNPGTVAARSNIVLPPTPVVPGDEIANFMSSTGRNWDDDPFRTFLYLEAVTPQLEPASFPLVAYDSPIPAAGTQIFCARIPPSLDGYEIVSLSASLGRSQTTSGDISVTLWWIRQIGRSIEDVTDDPVIIEVNEWTSDSADNPPTLFPTGKIALTGDILMATIAQSGANAEGLVIHLDFAEVL